MNKGLYKRLESYAKELCAYILTKVNVLICTASNSATPIMYKNFPAFVCFIDEAGKLSRAKFLNLIG